MIWFTSDQHYGHRNVIKYCQRPFAPAHELASGEISDASVLEQTRCLIENFNSVVKPDDHTFHLGDFSLHYRNVAEILAQLNGTHDLIPGNHDKCHPADYKKEARGERMRKIYYEAGFRTLNLSEQIQIAGQWVNLSHLPYLGGGDHTERGERYAQWRLKDNGLWLLHGHVHTCWKQKGRMINVGVDQWNYKPVSIEQLAAIIKKDQP